MKATALLKKDHAAVRTLFRRFEQTTPRAVKTRERLLGLMRRGIHPGNAAADAAYRVATPCRSARRTPRATACSSVGEVAG